MFNRRSVLAAMTAVLALAVPTGAEPSKPENLARKARVTATSEYNKQYAAKGACDGVIPASASKDDIGKAWVARGNRHPEGVRFTLEWPAPVTVAEIVYYGRTAWDWGENWKRYEVHLDSDGTSGKPVATGTLLPGHGPQRIALPEPAQAGRVTLKFLDAYGGPNPGASEIRVYAERAPDAALGTFVKVQPGAPGAPPPPPIKDSPELAARLKAGSLGFTKLVVVQRHHITCSHVYTYHCEGQKDGGGLCVYDVTDGSLKRLVDTPDGQILGSDLCYDGKTILFSWRRKESRFYQLWSIDVDGSNLKQLTRGDHFNYDGCWLPDRTIVFLSSRIRQAAYCFFTPVGILYRMNADGSGQRRISSNYLNDFTPAVMNDGRIIYGRWEYVDRPAIPIQGLWTINADGTMLRGYYGNRVLDPASFMEARPIPGSTAVLCTLTGHNGSCRGAVGIVDPTHGVNAQESIRNLTPEIRLRGVRHSSNGPRGPYQTPYPVDDRYFLVSHDGTLLLRDYDGTEQTVVLAPREIGFYNPQPLRERPKPPMRASTLPEQAGPWATVFVQDVYQGLEPHVKRGEVKRIAVVQEIRRSLINSPGIHKPAFDFQRIVVSCGATYVPKKVWGYADVAADGSAFFKVPAELPIYFMALDAQGRAVQRMRSFTHLMPGEVQGCGGCHAAREETSPESRVATTPPSGEPQELTPPEWGTGGFDYASIVQPVLDRHCVECHNPQVTNGVDLSGDRTEFFNVSYEHLARKDQGRTGSPYISWIPTYNGHEWNILEVTPKKWGTPASKLADLILDGHKDADGKPRVNLDENGRRRVLAWIDLNVPYYATADTAHPALPACRQLLPPDLQRVMDDVYTRRCVDCHGNGGKRIQMPWQPGGQRGKWGEVGVRVENPHLNPFLLAPLAKSAGGTERCGRAVFATKEDKDYKAVLATFLPIEELMKRTPRMDMPGAKPAACCLVRCDECGDCDKEH